MNFLLVGFFNSPNLGDILIADNLYNLVSSKSNTIKLSYSGNPNIITDLNNIKETNLKNSDNYKLKVFNFLKNNNLVSPLLIYKKIKKPNHNLYDFEKKIKEVDCLVIGGGNMIFTKDKFSSSAERFNNVVSLAKINKKKVFAISLGIGPFKTKEQELIAIEGLKKCDYITFRDQKSYDIYAKNVKSSKNVFISVDPVFSLPYILDAKPVKLPTIGVNIFDNRLIDDSKKEYANQIKSYVSLVNSLVKEGENKVILFSTDLKDYEAVKEVYANFKNNGHVDMYEINGLNDLVELYEKFSILIASRMHSMIIAHTQFIPVIGLSWQPKIESFFEIIDSSKDLFIYNEINDNIDLIKGLVDYKLLNMEKEKEKIKKNLRVIKKKRQIDEEILDLIIKNN